ncbi:enoyl-CoA hydratase-related protein [Streptomyces sp. NPDC020792]|uniref:enoyl-CoA hydratase-related protein n=1 Tax=Streptomyces sp. NPDC020792 TaxID=3365089 RepID=UPI0037AB7FC6
MSASTDLKDGHGARTERGGEYGMIRRRRTKALIAAVEGPALGGGFEIVLACDLVVASTSAYFGLPQGLRGVLPTPGALFRAARCLPRNVATRMMLTGEPLTPRAALALGLVNEVTEPGRAVEEAVELAGLVCRSAPTSVTQILRAQQELDAEEDACGWQATAAAVEVVLASEDMREGAAAFFEKRPPQWPTR